MPFMDGIHCTRTARALGYVAPIVALTAYADGRNEKECLDAGMNFFLAKPIERGRLREVLAFCDTGATSGVGGGVVFTPGEEKALEVVTPPVHEAAVDGRA